jgi:hypothetical protein
VDFPATLGENATYAETSAEQIKHSHFSISRRRSAKIASLGFAMSFTHQSVTDFS